MQKHLIKILEELRFEPSYRMVFPDGAEFRNSQKAPVFTVHFKTEQSIAELLRRGSVGFGEAYMREEVDIEGDLVETSHLGFELLDHKIDISLGEKLEIAWQLVTNRNTVTGSQKNISHHYDLGNEFYSLWLDPHMQYTCAFFSDEKDSLRKAQEQKLHLVCQKLRLQPGELLVEAGCGWGGLARFAAKHYGVRVKAFNISKEQIAYARQRAAAMKLDSRVEYILDDYRNIPDHVAEADKFVSVGMLEHVGKENYDRLRSIISSILKPDGLALIHSIGKNVSTQPDPWLERYIFPGHIFPTLSEMTRPFEAESIKMHVVDVENLRYHYALTLDHWAKNFEKHVDKIRMQYGESFVRMFRLYLRASQAGFLHGGIMLFQVLVSNSYEPHPPLTRDYMKPVAKRSRGGNGAARARSGTESRSQGRAAIR